MYAHIHIHRHNPQETNQDSASSVVVLAWAGLVNYPTTVLHLSSMAIPGKVLATKAISVQRLSFTVSLYPLGRAEALRLFQKRCLSSEGSDTAVNVSPHVTLGAHPETDRSGVSVTDYGKRLLTESFSWLMDRLIFWDCIC